jgi:hypothetical protein|tara:strand:+ start:212 stop:415 length:204 start_codon:yes stop_codon:yes gene_type:complete
MLELIAKFSPRLTALLGLPRSINRLLTAIEDVIHDQGVAFPTTADPKVQIVLNEVKVVRLKLHDIRG